MSDAAGRVSWSVSLPLVDASLDLELQAAQVEGGSNRVTVLHRDARANPVIGTVRKSLDQYNTPTFDRPVHAIAPGLLTQRR